MSFFEDLHTLLPEQVEPETFFSDLRNDPLRVYTELDQRIFTQNTSFFFPENKTVLRKILADINSRLTEDSVLELDKFKPFKEDLLDIRRRACEIHRKGFPLKEMHEVIVSWVNTMENLLRSSDIDLVGNYHQKNAAEELQKLLYESANKGIFVFFSFVSVAESYFWQTRVAPVYFIGLYKIPKFQFNRKNYISGPLVPTTSIFKRVDGFNLTPREFMFHDFGHAGFFHRRDAWIFETAGFPRKTLVADFLRNMINMEFHIQVLDKYDKILGKIVKIILFEVIHERGYQFYLPILRQQLSTQKWTNVIRKKIESNYFHESPAPTEIERLEEARQWLLEKIEIRLFEENIAKIHSTEINAYNSNCLVKFWPEIKTFRGIPKKIEIEEIGKIFVVFTADNNSEKELRTSIFEVALAQVSPSEIPIFSPNKIDAVHRLLLQKQMNKIQSPVLLSKEGIPSIETFNFREISNDNNSSTNLTVSPVEIFKIEQILFLQRENLPTDFSVTSSPQEFLGKVTSISLPNKEVSILDSSQKTTKTFKMVEVSIQPA